MSQTSNGKAQEATAASAPKQDSSIIIRPGKITDGFRIGEIASKTYMNTPLIQFLSPGMREYYSDYERGFQHRATGRMLNPNNVTFVACEASNPSRAVGYAQFCRLGEDEGVKRQIASRKSVSLTILAWLFWIYVKIYDMIFPDRSANAANLKKFEAMQVRDTKIFWDKPERKNRWHAQSVVIADEFQRRGIGRRLMREAIVLSEAENVPIGLEASDVGRLMYENVGFDFLGNFTEEVGDASGGGVMMYSPSSWKK